MKYILRNRSDRRNYQIFAYGISLSIGLFFLDFNISVLSILTLLLTCICTQFAFTNIFKIKFKPKGALVTALSLSILIRSEHISSFVIVAFLSVASKFIIRIRHRHIFNPSVFGIIMSINFLSSIWISLDQWKSVGWMAYIIVISCAMVASRSRRFDVSFAFIFTYALIILVREIVGGEYLGVQLSELENVATLMFAFLTLSDVEITPITRWGRIFFGILIACITLILKIKYGVAYDLLYTLFFGSMVVPLINAFCYKLRSIKSST